MHRGFNSLQVRLALRLAILFIGATALIFGATSAQLDEEIIELRLDHPFVYAIYAVNNGVHLGENLRALDMARSTGLKIIEKIVKIESKKLELSEEICFRYLTERIRYDLGEKEINGILTYGGFLTKLEEIGKIPSLQIYSE